MVLPLPPFGARERGAGGGGVCSEPASGGMAENCNCFHGAINICNVFSHVF